MNTTTQPLRVVIVGGVAAGASCAARLRRLSESAHITLIERGPDVSFANCGLPYYIGGEITDRSRLALQTPVSLSQLLSLSVCVNTEAVHIDREKKQIGIRHLQTLNEELLPYDKLLLTPGASPLRPPLSGIDDPRVMTLRNLQDMDRIHAASTKARSILIVGAGFIGLEMAEQLIHKGKEVTLVEMESQVLPQMDPEMTEPAKAELEANGVRLLLGDALAGFDPGPERITARLKSGTSLSADMVILSIGVRPDSHLAKDAGLELGKHGAIVVNKWMQTGDPDIYAAGDAIESFDRVLGKPMNLPLGCPANRQWRIFADHIILGENASPYPGHLGSSIVRVFDATCGTTGWTEKKLREEGVEYETATITDMNHAGYYPGAVPVTIKVLWEKKTGRLLGGQAVGAEGVDKRVDVLATAITAKMSVEDLVHLELVYAPPFGSARDVVNTVGFAAQNQRRGLVSTVKGLPENGSTQLLDVRPQMLAETDPIPGALNIPFGELRTRLSQLDRNQPVTTICAMGKTSYFAARVLEQNGFDVRSVMGGWRMIKGASDLPHLPEPLPSMPADGAKVLDVTGLSCPGPLTKMSAALNDMSAGSTLIIKASDPGFARDVQAFCKAQGHELLGMEKEKGIISATVRKIGGTASESKPTAVSSRPSQDGASTPRSGATIICFSGELDKALAAFVIATGAAAMGGKTTIFFTFWGLNAIRKSPAPHVEKDLMGKMFGMMLPCGPDALPLSNMHMAGMGTKMMKYRMGSKNLPNLPDLMTQARELGVRLIACSMSMEAMGITIEELEDGVEIGGVADMLDSAATTPSFFI